MGEEAVLASSPTKSWLELNQQLTSPAKCGVFYVKQVNTVLPVNRCYDQAVASAMS